MAVFPIARNLLFILIVSSAIFAQATSVAAISPANGASSEDDTPALSWMATHASGFQMTCNIYIDDNVALPNVPVRSGVSYIANAPLSLSAGQHKWFVSCWDSMHNSQTSEVRAYTVLAQPSALAVAITGTPNEYEQPKAEPVPVAAASISQPSLGSALLFLPIILLPAILLIILLWSKKNS